jgi:hypothetical protein
MAQALLASIGPDNKVSLEATFDPDPLYSLTPRQIVDAMFAEHGMTNPQDLAVACYGHRCTNRYRHWQTWSAI